MERHVYCSFFLTLPLETGAGIILQNQKVIRIEEPVSARERLFDAPEHDCFGGNELLADISGEAYAQIAGNIQIVHYGPREVIFEEDEPGSCLYLIAQGSVRISKKGRGGQQETLACLTEGDFFGEMALIDRARRSAQAAAVGHAVLGRIDRGTWDLLLRVAPHEVLNNFTRSVTKRLRSNNQHFIEAMMRNERLSLIGNTISSVVHDMNNPMASILSACEVIQDNSKDELTSKMAGLIREAISGMETMTHELLDFSRGRTQLNLQSVSLEEFLQQLEPDFAKCRPRIDVRVEAVYRGQLSIDRDRLLRVFGNLIRNAREAMEKNGGNLLRFSIRRVESSVRFEISDTGGGIPSQLLPRIFEPFITQGKANRTGLGLAISKSVVEAHHGSISVQSSDKGTTVQVDLPLAG